MSALKGLKILDFSGLLPAPYGTRILADMGAEVLRIEAPTRPDMVRVMPPFDEQGLSAAHSSLNRNKGSLVVDLKTPQGVEIIKKLVQEYDIVVEQFRPNVMARLGLGYDDLN
ncbi:MAG: CoA transferase, partial [Pseudomonadales bacterium]|nr:CoA transferase [Pseudomonadales bacterium]